MSEKVKLLALLLVLAFMVRSYFNSDAFERGYTVRYQVLFDKESACSLREQEVQEVCKATLAQELTPMEMSCMSSFHDLFVCQFHPDGRGTKHRCSDESRQLYECMQAYLEPYGFSHEEVLRLFQGGPGTPARKKKSPSVDVAKGIGENDATERKEDPGNTEMAPEGKEDGAGVDE